LFHGLEGSNRWCSCIGQINFTRRGSPANANYDLFSLAFTTHHNLRPRAEAETISIMNKIAMLTEILQQNPADSFARYGLAMAHLADNNTGTALTEFTRTIEQNPDYVPAYQMSAQTLAKLHRNEEATARLHAGLDAAKRTNNTPAASEMQTLLDELELAG